MIAESKLGIFGIGPGSIATVASARPEDTIVFQRDQTVYPRRSTNTLTRGFEEQFASYVPSSMMMQMDSLRFISTRGTDFTVPTSTEYCMIDFPGLMDLWHNAAKDRYPNIQTLPPDISRKDIRISEDPEGTTVNIQGTEFHFDSVIDSTGNQALLASQIEPNRANEDPLVAYVYGATFHGDVPAGQMILVFNAGGGTSWVNPSIYKDGNEPLIDVCFSGWGRRSHYAQFKNGDGRRRLDHLVNFINGTNDVHLEPEPLDLYHGLIRSQRTPLPQSRGVFAVGEAGGIAKPFLGMSFNRALRSGQVALETISKGGSPADYYADFYRGIKRDDLYYWWASRRAAEQQMGYDFIEADALGELHRQGVMSERFVQTGEIVLIDDRIKILNIIRSTRALLKMNKIYKRLIQNEMTRGLPRVNSNQSQPEYNSYPFPPIKE